MKTCKTGDNHIRKVASKLTDVECVGNRTGGLGGIANDTAFIKYQNGTAAIITIFTCLSPRSVVDRETVIVRAASLTLKEISQLNNVLRPKL